MYKYVKKYKRKKIKGWILPIHKKEKKMVDKTEVCPYSQRSLERWLSLFRKHRKEGLIPKTTRPKETSIRIKERRKLNTNVLKQHCSLENWLK